MEIRALEIPDLLLCETFGQGFHDEKQIPGDFSLASFIHHWTTFFNSGMGTILGLWDDGRLVGGIGGLVTPDITSGHLIVSEMFWYVDPDARHGSGGIRLITALRAWGKAKGAVRFRMVHMLLPGESPETVRLGPIYERLGLRAIEVAYDGPIGD